VIPDHVIETFFRGEASHGVNFGVNAPVRVTKGAEAGKTGSVISLEDLEPEPTYLVELGEDGRDIKIKQSDLEGDR